MSDHILIRRPPGGIVHVPDLLSRTALVPRSTIRARIIQGAVSVGDAKSDEWHPIDTLDIEAGYLDGRWIRLGSKKYGPFKYRSDPRADALAAIARIREEIAPGLPLIRLSAVQGILDEIEAELNGTVQTAVVPEGTILGLNDLVRKP